MTAAETLHNAFRLRRNQCASLLLMPLVLVVDFHPELSQ